LPSDGFGASDLSSSDIEITYTSDLNGWKNARKDFHPGNQVATATIGTLMAHEFGHTNAGLSVLSLKPIDASKMINGMLNTDPRALKWDEVRTVMRFENAFRREKGLPSRTHHVNTDVRTFKGL